MQPTGGLVIRISPLEIDRLGPNYLASEDSIISSENSSATVVGRPAGTNNSLDVLIAIAAVIEACVIPVAQLSSDSRENSAWLQISAATAEAMILRETVVNNTFEILRSFFLVLFFIENLELLNGVGTPQDGDAFHNCSVIFSNDISNMLNGAFPAPGEWFGPAADAYSQGNNQQLIRLAEIAKADRQVAQVLGGQAEQVERGREVLAGVRAALVGALTVLLGMLSAATTLGAIEARMVLGRAAIVYLEKVVWIALVIAGITVISLIDEGARNELRLNSEVDKYKSVVDDVDVDVEVSAAIAITGHEPAPVAFSIGAPKFPGIDSSISHNLDDSGGTNRAYGSCDRRISASALSTISGHVSQCLNVRNQPNPQLPRQAPMGRQTPGGGEMRNAAKNVTFADIRVADDADEANSDLSAPAATDPTAVVFAGEAACST